ncbi:MAG TPA: recombinase family protein [Gemmatimonadales bacterium]
MGQWLASYARKSRALGDPDEVDVVGHQLRACDRWAEAMGLTIPPGHRIAEVGSGESIEARPKFAETLAWLESKPLPEGGLWFVTEVSRFSRAELEEMGRVIRILREAGVKPVVAGRTYDLKLPDDEQFFCFQAVNARAEVRRYSWRMDIKREEQFENAEVILGKAPWGYVYDDRTKTLLPSDDFGKLVAACREILTEGLPKVAERHGIDMSRLYSTLTNPKICGYPCRRYGANRRPLPRHKWRLPEKQNLTYPHACTRAEWDAIQRVLQERWVRRLKTTGVNGWCRDLVRFNGHAGRPVLGSMLNYGERVNVYELRQPDSTHRLAWIEREKVHTAVWERLQRLVEKPENLTRMVEGYIGSVLRQKRPGGLLVTSGEPLEDVRRRYQETVDAEFDAVGPLRQALNERRVRLEAELLAYQEQARAAARQVREEVALAEQLRELPALMVKLPDLWASFSEGEKRQVVRLVVARVECRYEARPGPYKVGVREVSRVVPQPWFDTGQV